MTSLDGCLSDAGHCVADIGVWNMPVDPISSRRAGVYPCSAIAGKQGMSFPVFLLVTGCRGPGPYLLLIIISGVV